MPIQYTPMELRHQEADKRNKRFSAEHRACFFIPNETMPSEQELRNDPHYQSLCYVLDDMQIAFAKYYAISGSYADAYRRTHPKAGYGTSRNEGHIYMKNGGPDLDQLVLYLKNALAEKTKPDVSEYQKPITRAELVGGLVAAWRSGNLDPTQYLAYANKIAALAGFAKDETSLNGPDLASADEVYGEMFAAGNGAET